MGTTPRSSTSVHECALDVADDLRTWARAQAELGWPVRPSARAAAGWARDLASADRGGVWADHAADPRRGVSVGGRGTDLLWPARGRPRLIRWSPMTPRLVGLAHLAATPLLLWSGACSTTDSCIAAGSRIATPEGWLAIELLQPGDSIYAVDVANGALVATVVSLVRRSQRECVALVGAGGRRLSLTPDHPVYAPGHVGFVVAGRFVLGQVTRVLTVAEPGPEARAEVTELGACSTYAGVHSVFDLGVAGAHPTFIAEGFVVHNKSFDPSGTSSISGDDGPPTTGGGSSSGSSSGDSSGSESTGTTGAPTTSGTSTGGAESSSGSTAGDTEGALFPCGDASCLVADEYCEVLHPGDRGETIYSCLAIPGACQPQPDCTCLNAQGISGECAETPEGGLRVEINGA